MTPSLSDVSVLVPAAGSGERLGMGPKAWLVLDGRPVIDWVADKAAQLGSEVLVACPADTPAPAGCVRVEGGSTRQDSVHRLVRAATKPWVLVWDAARPFGSVRLGQAVLEQAARRGAAGAFAFAEVSTALVRDGQVDQAVPAGCAAVFQTPQAFAREVLLQAMERAAAEGWQAQSVVELVLKSGHAVDVVPGEKLNIKLTTPDDWRLALAMPDLLR